MKKKMYIAIAGLALTFCTACEDFKFGNDFLDKPISTDLTIDTVFAHKKYADQALAEVYFSMPDFMSADGRMWTMLEILTDLGDSPASNMQGAYYNGTVTAATSPGGMPYRLDDRTSYLRNSSPMGGMRAGYTYLNNVDRVPDMSNREKVIRKEEVKTIMAFHYTQMFRYYGGMPWVDRSYKPDEEVNFPRMTVEEHVQKVVDLCDEAAKILPWSVSPAEEGHMTAASALAIKNRILQFAASPLFNSEKPYMEGEASDARYTWWGDYDPNRWQKALDSALELLDRNVQNGNYYQLVNTGSPRADFRAGYNDRGKKEALVVSHRYKRIANNWYAPCRFVMWGYTAPSNVLADEFETKNGEKYDWQTNAEHAAYPFFKDGQETRDPRLYETLIVNEDELGNRKAQIYEGGLDDWNGNSSSPLGSATRNGIAMRKFLLDYNYVGMLGAHFYQCPHIRMSEIYLNIAEAMNQLGIANTKDKFGNNAYDYINMVRDRAGMPAVTPAMYPQGDELQEAILHERAVEFAFEEVRYFDINRWKRKDLLERQQYRLKTYKDGKGWRYDRSTPTVHERMWVQRWSDKYYLLPIPTEEINKNYGLVQNPGW